jgi:hypothetical protein
MSQFKVTGRDTEGRAVFSLTVEATTTYDAKAEAIRHMSRTPNDRVNLLLGGKLVARKIQREA